MINEAASQMISKPSPYGVSQTTERLVEILKRKGVTLFAQINHSDEAHKMHMELQEEKVLIFGDPKVGTFLMQENPAIGIELPLKVLIWQSDEGKTLVAFQDPVLLGNRYGIIKNREILQKMKNGLDQLVNETIQ